MKLEIEEMKHRIEKFERILYAENMPKFPKELHDFDSKEKYHAYFHHDKISPKKALETLMEILQNHPIVTLQGVNFTVYEIPINEKTRHGAIHATWHSKSFLLCAHLKTCTNDDRHQIRHGQSHRNVYA